ncbi:GyrI-like domain-containing protein [Alkalibacter mobilis]|uniref:GyrI-like domain-containing protein n=1 Tax=Alkalibacter mobilis TaxID=2787712 RepID=UPI00189C885B|nr:GyrI-like domain-containing protein [Alkalibacter mobilis]MBF7096215.1 GyrI-like domain-containing protein [Alkalibacter mobilis]
MDFELIEKTEQPIFCIRTKCEVSVLIETIDRLSDKLMEHFNDNHLKPVGPLYTAYSNFEKKTFDLEVGYPTDKYYPGLGNVISDTIPGGTYLKTLFKGPYNKLRPVYQNMYTWIEENDMRAGDINYEIYYNSHREVSDDDLITEILLPVFSIK